jgi:mannosyl-3-phosphoglycerate phosphatase
LRQTSTVLYIAIDDLVPARGNFVPGFDEFSAALDHAGIPAIWVSSRTRMQLDEPRRKLDHSHPFIAEDGCGVYLPEDYFHLRPESPRSGTAKSATVRLGRFTCLPVAEQQPAAAEALEALSEETCIEVVPLRSLSPREAAQNANLPPREAELARQRDFDELFFFAGAPSREIAAFHAAAKNRSYQIRARGSLWSIAVGATLARCVRELTKLYDRALHSHARTVALAVTGSEANLFSVCDGGILLMDRVDKELSRGTMPSSKRTLKIAQNDSQKWEKVLESLTARR